VWCPIASYSNYLNPFYARPVHEAFYKTLADFFTNTKLALDCYQSPNRKLFDFLKIVDLQSVFFDGSL
jgi:hypothetical protein